MTRVAIPSEYHAKHADVAGFSKGEWAELKRLVDEGYQRFWMKRGGVPNKDFNYGRDNSKKEERREGK